MGFGQLTIGLYFMDKLRAREPITSALEYDHVLHITDELRLGDFADFIPSRSCTKLFGRWWNEWKLHLFNLKASNFLTLLELEESDDEVRYHL
uniref:Uncharacterized protein n=1 Tax=Arundo donax TaxID=35708 RepID=A0A0A9DUR7_ARUDO